MKSLWTLFIQSLQLPKKQAVFTLNRIGMDTVVFYLFILIAISSIPAYIDQLQQNERLSVFFFTIFFFIFHYLVVAIVIFIILSIIAWIVSIIAKAAKRKLRFSILWKMTASATTIPFLLYTCIAFFYEVNSTFVVLAVLFMFIIVSKIIFIYPARKHKLER